MSRVELRKETGMVFEGFSLNGKIALVTGAARGLGLEIAKGLAASGAHVLLNGRNRDNLEAGLSMIRSNGGSAAACVFDVADERAADERFDDILKKHGRFDILVNNVGIRDRRELFEFKTEEVRQMLEVDLLAPFNLCRKAAKMMVQQKEGRIINIVSIAALLGVAGDAAYIMAKGGLLSLTRALAAELGPMGITVNAVAPGVFATETNEALMSNPEVKARLAKRTSLGRWGEPHEIAGAVVFLASPAAGYVTGHMLAVDGGYLTHF